MVVAAQEVDAALLESLLAMIGRLPLELVLVSFLFQVVKAYVAFDNKTLLGAVMKRLHASHRTLQVRPPHHFAFQGFVVCWGDLPCNGPSSCTVFPHITARCPADAHRPM